ncbi:uncharacterized protein LOC135489255 isoform X2 [Lineus longissimus]|uniref:uncharacterized protein LOC135489255 isoform X2 n=1 Tax=Lineus longissimus TaxID=88925 RepID=UPI002B4E0CA0
MPACEVCGEEDYECYDGCYYCVHCHTQSQKIHELDQEEDFLEGAFSQGLSIRMPKKTTEDSELNLKKKRKQVDGGRPWTSDEGFQLILREQVKSLIKMGADPVLKDVVFKFWTLYLSRLGMAFSDQERSRALFTKTYPLTRDIYVPTAENPTVPEVRWLKTSLKRGSIQKKDKHVDKMVMEALLGSEEFYEGDNPLDKGEDEDADRFIGICEENYEEGYLISSERISEFEDSCSLLDTASESSSNSDVGVRCEILLDDSDGGKVGNIGGGADEKCSFSSSSRSEQSEISLDASDEGEIGNVGGGDGKRGSTARGTSKNVAVSIRTRNQASKSFVAASSESVPVTKRTSGRVSKGTVSTKSTSGAERERKENEVFEGTDAAHSEENIVETEDWDKITGKCDPEDDNGLSDNDHDENKLRRGKRKVKRRMKLLAPSKKKIGGTIARTPWRLHMASTLAFCYIGLTFTNGNVVISDIMRWVRNGALPYHNIMDIFPDDMKLSSRDTFTFCGMVQGAVVPPHQRLSRAVGDLCRMLGITLPRLSLERLIGRYIIDMDLPGQLNALAMQLLKNSPVPDEAHVVGVHGIFPYEAMAMAYIVITLKMVIGLDDKTERVMSSYSKKIKDLLGRKAPDCPNVFVWEDWVMNMEEKMSSHRSREMPTNFGRPRGRRSIEKTTLDSCG